MTSTAPPDQQSVAVRDSDREARRAHAHEHERRNNAERQLREHRDVGPRWKGGRRRAPASAFQSENASSSAYALQQNHASRRRPRDLLAAMQLRRCRPADPAAVFGSVAAHESSRITLSAEVSRTADATDDGRRPTAATVNRRRPTMNSRRENIACLASASAIEASGPEDHNPAVSVWTRPFEGAHRCRVVELSFNTVTNVMRLPD